MTERESDVVLSDAAWERSRSLDGRGRIATVMVETDLLNLSLIVVRHKLLIATTTGLCAILAVVCVLLLPSQDTAEAGLDSLQSRDSIASLMAGSLSNLCGLSEVAAPALSDRHTVSGRPFSEVRRGSKVVRSSSERTAATGGEASSGRDCGSRNARSVSTFAESARRMDGGQGQAWTSCQGSWLSVVG